MHAIHKCSKVSFAACVAGISLQPNLCVVCNRLECSSVKEAEELVLRVRRSCAWWGRDSPPHVVMIVNPTSGTSR